MGNALRLTVREAFETHCDTSDVTPRTVQKQIHDINLWEKLTDNLDVHDVTDDMMAEFRRKLIEAGYAPATINGVKITMSRIFREIGPRETGNPRGKGIIALMPYFKPVRQPKKRPRRIPLEDIDKVYLHLKRVTVPRGMPHPWELWRTLIVTAFCTGMRKQDLFALRGCDIDLAKQTLTFQAQKTLKEDTIHLREEACRHLARVLPVNGDRVFGKINESRIYKVLHKVQDRAGVKRFALHDLRRTGASEIDAVERGLGKAFCQHAGRGVTDISYLNLAQELKAAVDAMEVPLTFKHGDKVQDRRDEEEIRQSLIEPAKLNVCIATSRRDWNFTDWGFSYRGGPWFKANGPKRLAMLKALASCTPEKPCTFATLAAAIGHKPDHTDSASWRAVQDSLVYLRRHLRLCFGLTNLFPVVQRVGSENGGCFLLFVPRAMVLGVHKPKRNPITPAQLKQYREQCGWSRRELSRRLGLCDNKVSKWENGAEDIPQKWVPALQAIFAEAIKGVGQSITGGSLPHIRFRAGMKQSELAEVLGLGTSTIQQWENGKRPIPQRHMAKLMQILGPFLRKEDVA